MKPIDKKKEMAKKISTLPAISSNKKDANRNADGFARTKPVAK